ncbi:unnamed protein product [Owenia fusiformis]|uniref:C2 domain-containing protein n=1 Tax=Owenia fusiformis TaxID=6347 RepID=A0A8S4PWR4_OWEFU|nr:unnamed protein product [Owenia fusiformis]
MDLPIWVLFLTGIGVLLFLVLVGIGIYHLAKYLLERRKKLKEQQSFEKTYRINLGDSIFEENPMPFLPEYWNKRRKKEKSKPWVDSEQSDPQHQKYEDNFDEIFRCGKSLVPVRSAHRAKKSTDSELDHLTPTTSALDLDRSSRTPLKQADPLWYDTSSTSRKNISEFEETECDASTPRQLDDLNFYGRMDYGSRSLSSADVRNLKEQFDERQYRSTDQLSSSFGEFGGPKSRTASAIDLNKSPSQMDTSKPFLKFSVILGPDGNIGVTLFEVIDIPRKYHKSTFYIRVNFFPKVKKPQTTRFIKIYTEPIAVFNECFEFCGIDQVDLEKSILRFCLMARDSGVGKDKMVGDLVINCSRLEWSESSTIYFRQLSTKRIMKRGTTSRNMMHMDLGKLFVVLQNQPQANRIKVFIKRATDLPNVNLVSAVLPEHYVIVNLLKNCKHVTYKETRAQKGQNPVWNEPFLFDISNDELHDYSIEFIIMRGRLFHKDGVLGHVVVGSRNTNKRECVVVGSRTTNKRGIDHWNDFIHPAHGLETAKWHDVLPVVSYIDDESKQPFY